jgi:hypothetical protein
MTVNALVILQDPILMTLEDPTMPADTLVGLQDLQELIITTSAIGPSPQEPIVTLSTTSLPPEKVHLQEPTTTTSVVTPSPHRMHPQESIVSSSAITPSSEQVCFIIKPLASPFPWPY